MGQTCFAGPLPPRSSSSPSEDMPSTLMQTCGEVKMAYKAAKCCGQPSKAFMMTAENDRRLSSDEDLLEAVKTALKRSEEHGGASAARSLSKKIDNIINKVL